MAEINKIDGHLPKTACARGPHLWWRSGLDPLDRIGASPRGRQRACRGRNGSFALVGGRTPCSQGRATWRPSQGSRGRAGRSARRRAPAARL